MPVPLGSLDGKGTPEIVRALRALATAVDQIDAKVAAGAGRVTAAPAPSAAPLLEQQVQSLRHDLTALAARVAALEALVP